MASVSGVSNSNVSSIYGNKNIISGLASGMDTEAMIENSVKGFQLKISSLQKQQTSLTWKQEAYRGISDSLVQLSQKYTSYTSSTNLLSSAFFNKAVLTTGNGANAEKVSATGKTASDVKINGVAQLATASRYYVDKGGVLGNVNVDSSGRRGILASEAVSLSGDTEVSNVSGSLSITYGKQALTLNFANDEVFADNDAFAKAIQDKLADQTITYSNGTSKKASEVIKVELKDGKVNFSDMTNGGNALYISGATGKMGEAFGSSKFTPANNVQSLNLDKVELTAESKVLDQIAGQTMSFSLDGTAKKITLPTAEELAAYATKDNVTQETAFTNMLQSKLDQAFGKDKVKVEDGSNDPGTLQLGFSVAKGSSLTINSSANTALGLSATESTALNTGKSLGDLIEDMDKLPGKTLLKADGKITQQKDGTYRDEKNNLVNSDGERLGKDGNLLYGYDLEVNGTKIGTYTRDTALETVLKDINTNTEAGVSVNYSSLTNQFVFNSSETGAGRGIDISGELGEAIFGEFNKDNYTDGQDAIVNMTVNGENLTVNRSNNTFDIDGLSVTLNETFNDAKSADGKATFNFLDDQGKVDTSKIKDSVSFTTKADSDKIVDAIKSMVTDMNEVLKGLREGFNTLPATKSNNSKYEPLTEDDKASMTESAVKNYEDKAKQGLLFGDRDLSALYDKLVKAFTPGGNDGAALRAMGITTTYTSGLTQIEIDETKLRDTLNSNPDAVRDAFTKVSGEGSSTNGLMTTIKSTMDTYVSVDGATKGILINKAGSKYSALSLLKNSFKDQIDGLDKQIEKWQDKMSNKVDYYTRQFTQLEKLVAQLNEQSNSIANLMAGGQ